MLLSLRCLSRDNNASGRFPSVNWKLASYGIQPWEKPVGVTAGWSPELDTLWYMEELACGVNFYF